MLSFAAMYLKLNAVESVAGSKASSIIFQQAPVLHNLLKRVPRCLDLTLAYNAHLLTFQFVRLLLVSSACRAHSILGGLDREAFITCDESGYLTVPC